MPKKKLQTKLCLSCRKVLPVTEFYKNPGWTQQSYCDVICKDCAKKQVVDKDTLKNYFWQNNRLYDDTLWTMASKRAMYKLTTDKEYYMSKSEAKKKQLEDAATALVCLHSMSLPAYYAYSANITEESGLTEYDPESLSGTVVRDENGDQVKVNDAKVFSKTWNGMYTQAEIDYMDDFYARLEKRFEFDDIAMEDAARKCAKSSLMYDKMLDKYRLGQTTIKELQATQSMYDSNFKSANFAACKRKESGGGAMALGMIVKAIEDEGLLATTKVKFPLDDIDRIIADFSHTPAAIGVDE